MPMRFQFWHDLSDSLKIPIRVPKWYPVPQGHSGDQQVSGGHVQPSAMEDKSQLFGSEPFAGCRSEASQCLEIGSKAFELFQRPRPGNDL